VTEGREEGSEGSEVERFGRLGFGYALAESGPVWNIRGPAHFAGFIFDQTGGRGRHGKFVLPE